MPRPISLLFDLRICTVSTIARAESKLMRNYPNFSAPESRNGVRPSLAQTILIRFSAKPDALWYSGPGPACHTKLCTAQQATTGQARNRHCGPRRILQR